MPMLPLVVPVDHPIIREVKRTFRLPPGDFPDLERFKESLKDHDFDTFAKMDEKLINRIDEVLGMG